MMYLDISKRQKLRSSQVNVCNYHCKVVQVSSEWFLPSPCSSPLSIELLTNARQYGIVFPTAIIKNVCLHILYHIYVYFE